MALSANLEGSGDAPHKYAWRFWVRPVVALSLDLRQPR
jgi:hypothetical protein